MFRFKGLDKYVYLVSNYLDVTWGGQVWGSHTWPAGVVLRFQYK